MGAISLDEAGFGNIRGGFLRVVKMDGAIGRTGEELQITAKRLAVGMGMISREDHYILSRSR